MYAQPYARWADSLNACDKEWLSKVEPWRGWYKESKHPFKLGGLHGSAREVDEAAAQ